MRGFPLMSKNDRVRLAGILVAASRSRPKNSELIKLSESGLLLFFCFVFEDGIVCTQFLLPFKANARPFLHKRISTEQRADNLNSTGCQDTGHN